MLNLCNWLLRLANFYTLWVEVGGNPSSGYSTAFPPLQIASAYGTGPALWIYNSADVHTDVDASGYFTDGFDLGMKVGDQVLVGKSSATIGVTLH